MVRRKFYPKSYRVDDVVESAQDTSSVSTKFKMFNLGGEETTDIKEAYILYIDKLEDIDYVEESDQSIRFDSQSPGYFYVFDGNHTYKKLDDAIVEAVRSYRP